MNVTLDILIRLVEPFLEQEDKVYVAVGCEKVFVAPFPAGVCKGCKGTHDNFEISSISDLKKILLNTDDNE